MSQENYSAMTKEDLEARVEAKKAELEEIQIPGNQEAMPYYHSSRAAVYRDLVALYDALKMEEAKSLAEASLKAEEGARDSWSKSLNAAHGFNNLNLEGGRRRRRSAKKRKPMKKHKYSRRR